MIANNAGNNALDNASSTNNDPQLIAAESKFRAHVTAMRIRLVDLFADFDKLRSGYITAAQFRRCIGAAYDKGVVKSLSTEERETIVQHYLVKQKGMSKWNGMVQWRGFVDSVLNNTQSATAEGI
jgi:Ca2+-binding EF-hand superfamily protein